MFLFIIMIMSNSLQFVTARGLYNNNEFLILFKPVFLLSPYRCMYILLMSDVLKELLMNLDNMIDYLLSAINEYTYLISLSLSQIESYKELQGFHMVINASLF